MGKEIRNIELWVDKIKKNNKIKAFDRKNN